jgi:type II secretory pathway component PulF
MALSAAQKHLFYTELAKLLEAGFGIREAAAAMLDSRLPAAQAALLCEVDRRLEAGDTIAGSFAAAPQAVTELELKIIEAGERGGRLAVAFQHLADYFEMLARSRRDTQRAMVYPLVLLHLGVFVGVVPTALMAGERDLPGILGEFLLALLVLYAAAALVVLAVGWLLTRAPHRPRIDAALNRVPWLGTARRAAALARFTKVYHTGLLAGLPMRETVAASAEASASGEIRAAGRRLERALDEGRPLGPEFAASGAFPDAFARSYVTAEQSGTLDVDLARWSQLCQQDASRASQALAAALPRIFYGVVVVFIAWKILAFWSRYYGMIDELTR